MAPFPNAAECSAANRAARFGPADDDGLPYIEVAGVLVFVYLGGGTGDLA